MSVVLLRHAASVATATARAEAEAREADPIIGATRYQRTITPDVVHAVADLLRYCARQEQLALSEYGHRAAPPEALRLAQLLVGDDAPPAEAALIDKATLTAITEAADA